MAKKKKKKKWTEPVAPILVVKPENEQSIATLPAITEEEFKNKIKAELTPEFLNSAFKNAIAAVKKHGISAFFKNPQDTIADTMLGMAKEGQLSIEENSKQKILTDGNDRT